MRIHSDFHDYYDIGLSVGVDPKLHYNRRERCFYPSELKTPFPPDTLSLVRITEHRRPQPDVERIVIGFCGVLYPCIRLVSDAKSVINIWNAEQLAEHFKFSIPSWGRPSEHWERSFRKDQRERERFLVNRPRADPLFLEMDTPLFVVQVDRESGVTREILIETNSNLRPFEFFKVFDPYSAFQEVSMYLGNHLVKRDVPDTIADEDRIAMHGYDKHSFRHPTRVSALK